MNLTDKLAEALRMSYCPRPTDHDEPTVGCCVGSGNCGCDNAAALAEYDCYTAVRETMLTITPTTLREANAYVAANHRHHQPVRGCIACVAVSEGDLVRGVAIIGRPVARMLDDGWTAEVVRCCTDGAHNACSMLYGSAWRAARALGYRKLVTYTLPQEGGASLRAAGWRCIGQAGGGSWSRRSRPRIDTAPTQTKLRWEQEA